MVSVSFDHSTGSGEKGKTMSVTAWDIYWNDKLIDTVYYTDDCDEAYVLASEIEEGQPDGIEVQLSTQYREPGEE